MNWLIAALIAGISFGANSVIAKYLLETESDFTYTYLYCIVAFVIYLPVFLYFLTQLQFELTLVSLAAVTVSGILNILAFLTFDEALKETDIGEVVPLTRVQPVFVGLLGALILSELLTPLNIIGIFTVTAGSYIALRKRKDPLITPLLKLKESRAHQYAMASAIFWSFAAIIDRFGTQQIPPEIYTFIIYTVMITGLSTNLLADEKRKIDAVKKAFKNNKLLYILTGITAVIGSLMIFTAFSLAPASKVIPVIQLQVLISVIGGILLFDEKGSRNKIIGSTILLIGVYLVTNNTLPI